MPPFLPLLLRLLAVLGIALPSFAAEPFLRPHDVIAIVGGEDMVVMSEYGYLELLLTRALPDHQLRFRNLAWEGDTVFEQRRDLNFPPLEAQLDKIGATVVIAQFGQMESLAGEVKLPEFIAAYEKLIERIGGGGKRRLLILEPFLFAQGLNTDDILNQWDERNTVLGTYIGAIHTIAQRHAAQVLEVRSIRGSNERPVMRDFCHLNEGGHWKLTYTIETKHSGLAPFPKSKARSLPEAIQEGAARREAEQSLLNAIQTKNKLWFYYWRPQNWAFLNGDRINQPSSRDHLDPSKRWFPAEVEEFIPLIEAKEREIDTLAQKLAKP